MYVMQPVVPNTRAPSSSSLPSSYFYQVDAAWAADELCRQNYMHPQNFHGQKLYYDVSHH